MKKLLSVAAALLMLGGMCILPVSAAAPSLSKWHAIQDENAPNRTIATAAKGRITVTSNFQSDKEPGGCAVTCEEPVNLSDFEITFSLDQYTKCVDQYLAIGFSSAPNTTSLYGETEHPGFMLLLRPTDVPNEITCGEGLLTNWDSGRKKIRVGKSSFDPGSYFEGTVEASWTNVKFAVKRNSANDGYDVYINDKRVNNQNKWAFADDIAEVTGGKWYLQVAYKDGNYAPATFTIKTINGDAAVDKNASGTVSGSYGSTPDKPNTTVPESSAPVTPDDSSVPVSQPSVDPGESSAPEESSAPDEVSAPESTEPDSFEDVNSEDASESVASSTETAPVDNSQVEAGNLNGGVIALIVVGAVVVLAGAGAAVYFLVLKKKNTGK